uniref:CD4-1 molecule n=1 Tax=Sphaeramia orbicularis TaxID=375764 RepID=A0A673BJW3_9TELE
MKDFIQSVFSLSFFILASGAQEVIYAQAGGTVILKTPPVNQLQNYYIYWFFNDGPDSIAWRNTHDRTEISEAELWNSRLKITYDKLTITNIQEGNYGTFTCRVRDALSKEIETKQYILLKVNGKTFLLPQESLSLTCEAETPPRRRPPQIHWLNPQGERLSRATGRQLTKKATSQDNGQWTCVVKSNNNNEESRAHISVTVMADPVPTQYTSKSSPLSIPCSIPSHISWDKVKEKGIQEVHWYFCSKPETGVVCNNSTLYSLSLEEKMTWNPYETRQLRTASDTKETTYAPMNFKDGVTISKKIHVEVLQVIISSPGTELIYGQQVNLTCSSGDPLTSDLQVKWFPPKDAHLRAPASGPHPAQLTIPEVGKEDNGKWRCELWRNSTQLALAYMTLKVEPKFSVWMLVTISGATVIAVLLLILIFILCRRRQRKMRHLRHRLCQCKKYVPTISWSDEMAPKTLSQSHTQG